MFIFTKYHTLLFLFRTIFSLDNNRSTNFYSTHTRLSLEKQSLLTFYIWSYWSLYYISHNRTYDKRPLRCLSIFRFVDRSNPRFWCNLVWGHPIHVQLEILYEKSTKFECTWNTFDLRSLACRILHLYKQFTTLMFSPLVRLLMQFPLMRVPFVSRLSSHLKHSSGTSDKLGGIRIKSTGNTNLIDIFMNGSKLTNIVNHFKLYRCCVTDGFGKILCG